MYHFDYTKRVGKVKVEKGDEHCGDWRTSGMEMTNCLIGGIFDTEGGAKDLIEMQRREYNQVRPHNSLGGDPPVPTARISI